MAAKVGFTDLSPIARKNYGFYDFVETAQINHKSQISEMTSAIRPVFIDWLAFSAPLSTMKYVDTYPNLGALFHKFEYLPSLQSYAQANHYTDNQTINPTDVPQLAVTEKQQAQYFSDLYSCYLSRLKVWIATVFGLSMGAPRGKGGNGYSDAIPLYSEDGGYDQLGLVYLGGNNETFFVQIPGKGCQYVFNSTTPLEVYSWLKHLDITQINRIDLATDDYDGVFTVDAAKKAYKDDAFYGGKGPKPKRKVEFEDDDEGNLTIDMIRVGSRQSRVFWRVYDKALEQKVTGSWYRSEVELKKISIDVLLDLAGIYVGLCPYAAQINPCKENRLPKSMMRKAIDSIEANVRWLRKQASANLAKVFHFFNGDINAVLSMIIREEHISDMNLKFDIPPLYQKLVNDKLQTNRCPF